MDKRRKRTLHRLRGFYYVKNAKQMYPTTPTMLPMREDKKTIGYYFFSKSKITIEPNETVLVYTDVKAYMRWDEMLKIYPYTTYDTMNNITIPNGMTIIYSSYFNNEDNDGNIIIPLKNIGNETVNIEVGDKIAIGIFEKGYLSSNDYIINEK